MTANIHADAYRGIGVNSRGTHYPFVAPSDDIRNMLADLWLSHRETTVQFPLRLAWITGLYKGFDSDSHFAENSVSDSSVSGATYDHAVDLVIVDATDTVIFDSRTAPEYYTAAYEERMRIHEWRSSDAVCKVVQHAAFPSEEDVVELPETIVPDNGELDPLCSQLVPPSVLGVQSGLTRLTGDVILRNGTNTLITDGGIVQEGLRRLQRIIFSAAPGSGLGRNTRCLEEDVVVRRINGVGGSERGDFSLVTHGCYYIRRVGSFNGDHEMIPTPATLTLGNDCKPCCECDDYVNTYAGLSRIHARFKTLATVLEESRDQYHANRTRWKQQKDCREGNPLTVTAAVFERQFVEVGISVCNKSPECLRDLKVYIEIGPDQCPADEDNERRTYVVSCSMFKTDMFNRLQPWGFDGLGVNNKVQGTLQAPWDAVNPGNSARLRFRLQILGKNGEIKPDYLDGCQFYLHVTATKRNIVYGNSVTKYFSIGDC